MRFFPTVIASLLGTLMALTLAFFFMILVVAGLASTGTTSPSVREGSVLVLPLSGVIPEAAPETPLRVLFEGPESSTLHEITRAVRRAADDERISALWLRPAGMSNAWASLEELSDALTAFRASGKPIIASSSPEGFSEKDYFIALSADHIFSPRAARFEFDGFVLVLQFYRKLLDRLDIQAEAIRAGSFKSASEPFTREAPSEENRAQLRDLLEAHSSLFVEAITRRRGLDSAAVIGMLEGGTIMSAESAREAGLVDSLLFGHEVETFLRGLTGTTGTLQTVSVGEYRLSPDGASVSNGTIALVNIVGTIVPGRSTPDAHPLFGGLVAGASTLTEVLAELRDDESVDAVVLRIVSPGGSSAASDAIWNAVSETARSKPVIASLGDVAASGGYYVAAAADTIVAERTTITGSIGVFSLLLNVSGFLEDKIGLTHDVVESAPHADMFTGLRPLSNLERAMLTDQVDRTYVRFKGVVAAARDLSQSEVEQVAQGRVWSGSDALDAGLVDQIGGLERAIEIAAQRAGLEEGKYRTAIYPRPRGFLRQLTDLMEAEAAVLLTAVSEDGPAGALIRQARVLETASELHGTTQALMPQSVYVE